MSVVVTGVWTTRAEVINILTLMKTSAQVVVTSVTTSDKSSSQDYTHLDDQTTLSHVTTGFKPFIISTVGIYCTLYHSVLRFWRNNLYVKPNIPLLIILLILDSVYLTVYRCCKEKLHFDHFCN